MCERVGADEQLHDFPFVVDVVGVHPMARVGGGGESVVVQDVVEEGDVLLPYLVGFVYCCVAVLVHLHHSNP